MRFIWEVGQSALSQHHWDDGVALIVGLFATIPALLVSVATFRSTKKVHMEVRSPNGKSTGEGVEALLRQVEKLGIQLSEHRADLEAVQKKIEVMGDSAMIAQSYWRATHLAADEPIFETAPSGDYVWVNSAWVECAGVTAANAMGTGWATGLHPDDRLTVFRDWYRSAHAGLPYGPSSFRFLSSGVITSVIMRSVPIHRPDGTIYGHVGTLVKVDDSDYERMKSEAGILSAIDDEDINFPR